MNTQDNSQANNPLSMEDVYEHNSRDRKIGLLWLIGPIVLLILVLSAYSLVGFMVMSLGEGSATVLSLIRVILGFLGLISVGLFMIGIPFGIMSLSKRKLKPGATYDERSGKGEESEIPEEIKKWNWGAAGLTWIWGSYFSVWIAFLMFVPFVNWIWWIVLGFKGNEWAWKHNKWSSVEYFLAKQKKWQPWGIVVLLLLFVPWLISLFFGYLTY